MQANKKTAARNVLAFAVTSLIASFAAADGGHEDSPESKWGIGALVGYETKPYKDFDNKAEALPMLTYENKWVRVFGPGIDLKLGNTGTFSYALTARYSNPGYEASDSSYLEGMDDRKSSFWVGGRVNWKSEVANLSAELLGDASGNSKGQQFKLGIDKRFQLGAVSVVPRAAIIWQDKNYVDYYYGVKTSEARADRAAYTGDAGVSTEFGVRMNYAIAAKQSVFLDLSATALPSSIKDSPLVDSSTKSAIRVGYLYHF